MFSVCAKTCSNHDRGHMNMTITFIFTVTATSPVQLLHGIQEFDHDAPCLYQHLTLSLINVLLLSVVTLCWHFLFTDNSFDLWFGSSKIFTKSCDSFAILSSRNDLFRNTCIKLLKYTLRGSTRTVCESVCLNVENMAPFVNILDICFPFAIFGIDIVERRLSLCHRSAVLPIASE